MNAYKQEIKKLKENLHLAEKGKDDLQITIFEKTNKLADIEAELCSFKDQLESTKKELGGREAQLKDLKNGKVLFMYIVLFREDMYNNC